MSISAASSIHFPSKYHNPDDIGTSLAKQIADMQISESCFLFPDNPSEGIPFAHQKHEESEQQQRLKKEDEEARSLALQQASKKATFHPLKLPPLLDQNGQPTIPIHRQEAVA